MYCLRDYSQFTNQFLFVKHFVGYDKLYLIVKLTILWQDPLDINYIVGYNKLYLIVKLTSCGRIP